VITRRKLVQYLPLACGMAPTAISAAEPKVIGILNPYFRADVQAALDRFDFEMLHLGYVKGRHYIVIERMAEGHNERLAPMAGELVDLKVDLIFASPTNAVIEAQRATSTIPIVFVSVSDPVGSGFAVNLAHPGHNLTGVTNFAGDLIGSGKRLELLKQMMPSLKRMVVLVTARTPNYPAFMPRLQANAAALGVGITIVEAALPLSLEDVFKKITVSGPEAIYVVGDPYLWVARKQVADLALKTRLPTTFVFAEEVEAGGLMSYGADAQDWMRQSAIFVDKIFKGANPGDLPIEQPAKIDLVINGKTAAALGLKIPQALLIQATRVID
jgi:putative ABC transport system substrate-binding protein